MHEASITEALLEAAVEEMERAGAGKILCLEVTVGSLSGVNVEALRFAFEMLSPGTPAQGAELRIVETRASCSCRACGEESPVDDPFSPCPACGSLDVEVRGGEELFLSSLEVDEGPEDQGPRRRE